MNTYRYQIVLELEINETSERRALDSLNENIKKLKNELDISDRSIDYQLVESDDENLDATADLMTVYERNGFKGVF